MRSWNDDVGRKDDVGRQHVDAARLRVRLGQERASALLEACVVLPVILAIGLGGFWTGNLTVRFFQLEKASQSATRYAARSETVPNGGASRRRTAAEIRQFVVDTAANQKPPLAIDGNTEVTISCGPAPASLTTCANPELQTTGNYIQVTVTKVVASNDPVMAFSRAVNGMLGIVHAGAPLPSSVTVSEASVAIIE
jgi:Flp pilus assembly protein TadG